MEFYKAGVTLIFEDFLQVRRDVVLPSRVIHFEGNDFGLIWIESRMVRFELVKMHGEKKPVPTFSRFDVKVFY